MHPALLNREEEIDQLILKLQEQGYNTVTKLAVKAFNYVSNVVMQTAIRVSLIFLRHMRILGAYEIIRFFGLLLH